VRHLVGAMGIGADRQDLAAKVLMPPEDVDIRSAVAESLVDRHAAIE
jgi:hypothetical protein